MCEPTTIMTAVSLAGTAMTAYGQVQQGKAQEGQSEYNAAVSRNNATLAANRGVDKENAFRNQTKQLKQQQRAHFGASGVELASGSAADILADTENYGELDALNIRSNTADEVDQLNLDARNEVLRGDNARSSANTRAFSSVLSGAGGVASKWYKSEYSANSVQAGY